MALGQVKLAAGEESEISKNEKRKTYSIRFVELHPLKRL